MFWSYLQYWVLFLRKYASEIPKSDLGILYQFLLTCMRSLFIITYYRERRKYSEDVDFWLFGNIWQQNPNVLLKPMFALNNRRVKLFLAGVRWRYNVSVNTSAYMILDVSVKHCLNSMTLISYDFSTICLQKVWCELEDLTINYFNIKRSWHFTRTA